MNGKRSGSAGEQEFEILRDSKKREAFLESVERMVDYAHENNIRIVVAGGSSAQPANWLFRSVWKQRYGLETMPTFFSLGTITTKRKSRFEVIQRSPKTMERIKKYRKNSWNGCSTNQFSFSKSLLREGPKGEKQ